MQSVPRASETLELFSLSEVVSATGFSAEVLRAWERRYGFPTPLRDGQGRRVFPAAQLDRLQTLRRLIDNGAKPSQVVSPGSQAGRAISQGMPSASQTCAIGHDADVAHAMQLLGDHKVGHLSGHLSRCLARRGARGFVLDVAVPLTIAVGEAWHGRRISIYQEHVCTEIMRRILGSAASAIGDGAGPAVLLATLPEESHGLGLAMVEVMLALEGCACVNLGLKVPVADVVAAAAGYRADVVALSFSSFYRPRQALGAIVRLRQELPEAVPLWVGGACSGLSQPLPAGVSRFLALQEIGPSIARLGAAGATV